MRVQLHSTLRALIGEKSVEVPLDEDASVRDLVRAMARRWPALLDRLLDDDGRISRQVNILVDGRNVRWLARGGDTTLATAKRIDLFPPTAGG